VNSGTRKKREGKKKIERLPIERRIIKWRIEVYIKRRNKRPNKRIIAGAIPR